MSEIYYLERECTVCGSTLKDDMMGKSCPNRCVAYRFYDNGSTCLKIIRPTDSVGPGGIW